MSTREEIIGNLAKQTHIKYDMPNIDIKGISYPDPVRQFMEVSKTVGGAAIKLDEKEDINDVIRSSYPNAKIIASNLSEITIATINPDQVADPHELDNVDLAIIEGEIGVAENGSVWIKQNVEQKVIYFIAEYVVIVLNRNNIVNNMHQAYKQINFNDHGFGVFISGPSKTADIEQSLVIGAHGAKGLTVILR